MNPACAAHAEYSSTGTQGNLFLQAPETDLSVFLRENARFAGNHPEIIAEIDRQLDSAALEKKRLRIADQEFINEQTQCLSGLEPSPETGTGDSPGVSLETGRPRISASLVFMFLTLRGFLGNLTSASSRRILEESISLRVMVENAGLNSMPAPNTITSHLNNLPHSLHDMILDAQVEDFLAEGLDDFKDLTLDSTSVMANSQWPTDGKNIISLASRTLRMGGLFAKSGFPAFREWHVPKWIEQMSALEFEICLAAGKANSRRKMKRLYKKLFAKARKTSARLESEFQSCMEGCDAQTLKPSLRGIFLHAVEQMRKDIGDIRRVIEYSENRVLHGESLPAKEKILSLSDDSAAYIQKGGREAVIGYKPQICRSSNGFIAALKVPEGNTSDSSELIPVMQQAIARTGVTLRSLSVDDGYSSRKGREHFTGEVEIVSISGSKGKKITPEEEWNSPGHREARRMRSAIESMMYTIKHNFEFGRLGRRGIVAVRSDLLEKALAYTFCRVILIRKRLADEQIKRAA
jgi:IS5 family transposase